MSPTAYTLDAYDPATFRRYSIGLTRAVEIDNPPLFGALIAETATTIAREWVRRYSVPFPERRIVWSVGRLDTEARADRLHRAEAIHE